MGQGALGLRQPLPRAFAHPVSLCGLALSLSSSSLKADLVPPGFFARCAWCAGLYYTCMYVAACQACGKFSALSTTNEKASSATAVRSKRGRRRGCRWCGLLVREAVKYRSAATTHARTEAANRARVKARAAEAKYGKAPARPAGTELFYPPK